LHLTGVTLGGDSIARWLEAESDLIGCVEIAAEGFFARSSPYLAWLGGRFPLFVRAAELSIGSPGPLRPERLEALVSICHTTNARAVVLPLGFREADDISLPALVPISLTPRSLAEVASRVAESAAACGRATLIEPVASPLRVPGSIDSAEFLTRLCHRTGARVLLDVATLLVAERNHGIEAQAWVRALPPGLIGAVRVSGSSRRRGRWHRDSTADIDESAWKLLALLKAHGQPGLYLLDQREPAGGLAVISANVARLERAAATGAPVVDPRPVPGPDRPLRAADDVALFVLDREGVFVSTSRRELTLFNAPATLIWCLIEDGRSVRAIVDSYAKTFDLTTAEAGRHVATMLQQWFGRGYIDDPGPLDVAARVDLTTALAHVLTSPRLRAAFRQSPRDLACRLGVAEEHTDCFVALDADELDDQADDLIEAANLPDPILPSGDADLAPPAASPPSASTRHYRLLSTTFAIDAGSQVLSDRIHDALAHLDSDDPQPDVVLQLRTAASGGWTVVAGESLAADVGDDGVVPAVKQLVRQMAVDRHPFLMTVHAGVVSFPGGCLLLPAAAGSGKTTLTAALVHSGATYFSDEIAPLEPQTLAVSPVPLSLTVKDGALAALRPLFPAVDLLVTHAREDHMTVRYLPPPPESMPDPDARGTVKWIVFPRYEPGATTVLRAIDRPAALRRLLAESFVDRRRLDRGNVESLVQWMRDVDCFELPLSTLAAAVAELRTLTGPAVELRR
jgi:uncharacterized protein (UPF0276 family)